MRGGNGDGNGERREGKRTIAVAVERNKASQSALKFAVDHLVYRSDHIVKLVHVIQRFPSLNPSPSGHNTRIESQADHSPVLDILLPFRGYCMRKNVKHEIVVLEDQDVARALIEYIYRNGVESFLLGASSKTGLARLFKTNDIPSSVLKWAPDFCSVYTIIKGKVWGMRAASRPVPAIPTAERAPTSSKEESHTAYDEVSVAAQSDFSFVSSERPSTTDSMPYSFYHNFGANGSSDLDSSIDLNTLQEQKVLEDTGDEMKTLRMELKQTIEMYHAACKEAVTEDQKKDMEDEIKGLRIELKQTIEMYHAASKEAVAAKQKAIELQEWTTKEELRLKDTQQALKATMAAMEEEKAKSKAAILAAKAAQRFAEEEVQKRVHAEQLFKALKEACEEKNKVLDALRQSQVMTRYRSLLHIFVVSFLFYFYFSNFS